MSRDMSIDFYKYVSKLLPNTSIQTKLLDELLSIERGQVFGTAIVNKRTGDAINIQVNSLCYDEFLELSKKNELDTLFTPRKYLPTYSDGESYTASMIISDSRCSNYGSREYDCNDYFEYRCCDDDSYPMIGEKSIQLIVKESTALNRTESEIRYLKNLSQL